MRRRIPKWGTFVRVGKLPRGCTIRSVIGTVALLASGLPAVADFPERNITLIVPFAAGGSTDVIARIVGDHMAKTLGRSIIIENDSGAGGTTPNVGMQVAASEALLHTLWTHATQPRLAMCHQWRPANVEQFIGSAQARPLRCECPTRHASHANQGR